MWVSSLCLCVSSSYTDTSDSELGSTHMTSFYLNHLFKGLISKYGSILRYWGLRLQCMNFEGKQSSSWYKEEQGSDRLLYTYHHAFSFGRPWLRTLVSVMSSWGPERTLCLWLMPWGPSHCSLLPHDFKWGEGKGPLAAELGSSPSENPGSLATGQEHGSAAFLGKLLHLYESQFLSL